MSNNNTGTGMTKADLILNKLDQLAKQNAALEARINSILSGGMPVQSAAAAGQPMAEDGSVRQELSYLSAQIESVYTALSDSVQKLSDEVAALREKSNSEALDVDDMASRVAAKIVIPEVGTVDVDSDKIADGVVARLNPDGKPAMDYDAIGVAVAKNIKIPPAIVEDIDYEDLSAQVADKLDLSAVSAKVVDMDYDAVGLAVAKNIHIPQAIAEDIDYESLSAKVAEKMEGAAKTPEVDCDALGLAVARSMYVPQAVIGDIDYEMLSDKVAEKLDISAMTVQAPAAELDYDELAAKVAAAMSVEEPVSPDYIAAKVAEQIVLPVPAPAEVDEEKIATAVAERLSAQQAEAGQAECAEQSLSLEEEQPAEEQPEEVVVAEAAEKPVIDEEALAQSVADKIMGSISDELIAAAVVKQLADVIDSDEIADCVAKKVGTVSPEEFDVMVDDDGCNSLAASVEAKLDYDRIAAAISEKLAPVVTAENEHELDVEELAKSISEKLNVGSVNEDVLAEKAAAVLSNYMPEVDSTDIADKVVAGVVAALPAAPVVDTQAIAAAVSEKLVENQENSDYDIVIDEEGLARITEGVAQGIKGEYDERLDNMQADYNSRLDKIESDLASAKDESDAHYNARLDKIESDIAASGEKSVENREDSTYDIMLDEDSLNRITESVAQGIRGEYDERLNKIQEDLANAKSEGDVHFELIEDEVTAIKSILLGSTAVVASELAVTDSTAVVEESHIQQYIAQPAEQTEEQVAEEQPAEQTEEQAAEEQPEQQTEEQAAEEQPEQQTEEQVAEEQPEEQTEEQVAEEQSEEQTEEQTDEEPLVTVSEVMEEQAKETENAEESAEDQSEEELVTVSDLVDEQEEEAQGDDVIASIVEDIDEQPVDEEVMPDGMEDETSGGVDFANMMKYNRSFIARIIQGTDEQKNYYGMVKTALLSYKKVNSNIAWGAERFNKGRETIARFKIRGKTLCLYLALDPNEFATSVYHHVDVSDNKSMHGTPMMVKIKSPLGARKAIRLIDEMLARRGGVKREIAARDYAAMYPYETIEELIEDGLVKDVRK